jgi:hypothetical protein
VSQLHVINEHEPSADLVIKMLSKINLVALCFFVENMPQLVEQFLFKR